MSFLRRLFGGQQSSGAIDADRWMVSLTVPGAGPEPDRPGWPTPLAKPDRSIEAWWTPRHDALLRSLIEQRRWWWSRDVDKEIEKVDPAAFAAWTSNHSNLNRLLYFVEDRALRTGLYKELLSDAASVDCARCHKSFLEFETRGQDLQYRPDICKDCIDACIWAPAIDNRASGASIRSWIWELAQIAGRVPRKGYATRASDLGPLSTEARRRLLDHVARRPSDSVIDRRFGGWLQALIASGVLPDGTRRTARGIQSIAVDGHVCYSLGEKTIDDFLAAHGIPHEREPRYPSGGFRGDFLIGGAIVEYFGLAGDAAYDAKTLTKRRICEDAGVTLIGLFAEDLLDDRRLREKLMP